MNRSRTIAIAKVISVAAVAPILLLAFSGGPDPGLSGAPGEMTCTACHTGTALNGGPGGVAIAFPGTTYTPNAVHRVSITVSDPNQSRWGFQLSARRADRSQAGTFSLADPVNTQLNPAGNVQYVQHTSQGTRPGTRNSAIFEVDWMAPSADAGPVTFYVAANAANANFANTGDRVYATNLTVQPGAGGGGGGGPRPSISQSGVVNGASFQPNIAAGSWITVRGSDLAGSTRTTAFENGRYPTEADGVRVSVNGKPAYLYFLSPGQINAIAPDDEAEGPVQVVVTRDGAASEASTVQIQRFSPAFFPWPQNQAVATDAQFNWKVKNGTFQGVSTTPAAPGDVVILWGTGFGPTNPAVEAGRQVTGAPTLVNAPTITVGGVQAEYLGGALSPGFAGLYQIAIRVPGTLQNGDHPVVASFGSFRSPDGVVLAVQR